MNKKDLITSEIIGKSYDYYRIQIIFKNKINTNDVFYNSLL